MKALAYRRPLAFALLVSLSLFVLAYVCGATRPTRAPQTMAGVFQVLAAPLAVALADRN